MTRSVPRDDPNRSLTWALMSTPLIDNSDGSRRPLSGTEAVEVERLARRFYGLPVACPEPGCVITESPHYSWKHRDAVGLYWWPGVTDNVKPA